MVVLLNPYRFAAAAPVAATALTLPGTNTNYASTPSHSSWDVLTGDLDLRAKIAPTDWSPDASKTLIARANNTGGQRVFNFYQGAGGANSGSLLLQWWDSSNVAQGGSPAAQSSVAASTIFTDGQPGWVRATLELNVAGVWNVKFYTSTDGSSWTQLGTTKVGGAATSLHGSTAPVSLGSFVGDTANGSQLFPGDLIKAEVRNGVAGTVVGSFDATAVTRTATRTPTTYTDPQGHVWTVNGTGWDWKTT
jgi:hypothetical protein